MMLPKPSPVTKLLIIGRGSIGKKHERNAQALGVQYATVDPDPEQEADYPSLEEALDSCGDGAFSHALVASPVQYHYLTLLQLLDSDVPSILVEKPLVLPEELEAMRRLSVKPIKQSVFVGFNWRFNSGVQHLKQKIQDGDMGSLHVAQLWAREWLPRYGGHVVLESGSHILDTARYLLGNLTVVGAHVSQHGVLGEADEAGSFLLESETGVHVSVHVNFIHSGTYDYTINVQGKAGSATCEPDRFESMHLRELEAFFQGNSSMLATLDDGVKNMELLETILAPQDGAVAYATSFS
jgi:predicted dehydrogenase